MPSRFIQLPLISIALVSGLCAQTAFPGHVDAVAPTESQAGGASTVSQTDGPNDAAPRLHWLMRENVSPPALLWDVAEGADKTRANSPWEYAPHWEGFGKRIGITAANYGVQTVMEAGLGSIWGEDPRYDRMEGSAFTVRLGHVVKMTFLARNRTGNLMPAYSRFLAIPGSSFLANTWMPDSQATLSDAAVRTGMGFLGRMGNNAWKEFRPRR